MHAASSPRLSIIICTYNEIAFLPETYRRVQAVDLGHGWDKQIIIVDNCSTDGTREFLQTINAPNVEIVLQPQNMGKGMSVRTGIARSRGDYAIIWDADWEYVPEELPLFVARAEQDRAEAVYGSRTLGGRVIYKYIANYLGVRVLTFLTNLLYGSRLTDVAAAPKMALTTRLQTLNLEETGFDLDFELTDKLLRCGVKIVEVPVSYHPRSIAQGKKIRPWDGVLALRVIFRDRFLPLSRVARGGESNSKE